jgi:predicted ribosomally synthesized peptide with SipW-like signal peptide
MKKILGLITALIAVIATLSVGTYAFFSDTETTGANTITAGIVDLSAPVVTWDTTFEGLAPGTESADSTVVVTNDSNIAVDHLDMTFTVDNFVDDLLRDADTGAAVPSTEGTYTAKINLITLSWSDGVTPRNLLDGPDGINGNPDDIVTLDDLNGVTFTGLDAPAGAVDN